MERVKKSREKIREEILLALNKKPLSIQQLSREIGSNWGTVNELLYELKEEGKVRETVSTEKVKFYQKIIDTYYNIPISEKQRQEFIYLFSLIVEEYKKQKHRFPNRTELAKTAVAAIENEELMLNLPTVWYLYGKIPLMVCDPAKEYPLDYNGENADKIKRVVSKIVLYHMSMNARELKKGQYEKYDMALYKLKDKITNSYKLDRNFLGCLNEFLINCPTNNFPELFILTERLVVTINKLAAVSDLDKYRIQILLTFQSLWKYIATFMLFESLTRNSQYSDVEEVMKFYLEKPLEIKKVQAEEDISNLESVYLSELKDKDYELEDEAVDVREVLSDMYG